MGVIWAVPLKMYGGTESDCGDILICLQWNELN